MYDIYNTINVVYLLTIAFFGLMTWLMWFFKVPLYKKSPFANADVQTCAGIILMIGGFFTLAQKIQSSIRPELDLVFAPVVSLGVLFFIAIWYVPEVVTYLRSKIPNRWEN